MTRPEERPDMQMVCVWIGHNQTTTSQGFKGYHKQQQGNYTNVYNFTNLFNIFLAAISIIIFC